MRPVRRLAAGAGSLLLAGALAGCGGMPRLHGSMDGSGDGTGLAIPAGSSSHAIAVGGASRTFRVYRPAVLPAAAPLVVMLHGGFGTGIQAERSYRWDGEAARAHFVVAYPDGLDRAWNTGGGCCGVPCPIRLLSGSCTSIRHPLR